MTDTPRQYKDSDGNPAPLLRLIKAEPEWAENQILHRDHLERELSLATATIANQHKLITDAEQRGADKVKQELAEAIKQRDFAKEHHRYYQQRTSDFMGANAELSDKLCAVTVERDKLKAQMLEISEQANRLVLELKLLKLR